MATTFEKDLLGQIICVEAGTYNFSADVLIGNVQQSTVRILCDTEAGRIDIQLPPIADFQNAYADLLIMIADIGNKASDNPITVTTGGDSFQFLSGTGYMDTSGQCTTLRVIQDGLWAVGGDGFTYGG